MIYFQEIARESVREITTVQKICCLDHFFFGRLLLLDESFHREEKCLAFPWTCMLI